MRKKRFLTNFAEKEKMIFRKAQEVCMKEMFALVLSLFFILLFNSNSFAGSYAGVDIAVTDLSGKEYKVAYTELFSINFAGSESSGPRKWFQIKAANITEAVFSQNKKATSVSVLLKDGSRMSGTSLRDSDIIRGKGPLGSDFTLPWNKVQKVVFLSAHVPDEFADQNYVYSEWEISDGDTKVQTKTLILVDSFLDNRDFYRGGIKKKFERRSTWHGSFFNKELPLFLGDARLGVPFKDISLIEITGKVRNGKPEVRIEKKDGTSKTLSLDFCTKYSGNKASFNGFDDEDSYAWQDKPFGVRGVSLKPLRKITFKQLK